MPVTWLAASAVHAVTAATFLHVGFLVARRRGEAQGAITAFAVWWFCLGLYLAIQALLHFVAGVWGPNLQLHLALRVVTVPLLCIGPAGLTYYFICLFTGRKGSIVPVALVYATAVLAFYVASFSPMPTGLRMTDWLVDVDSSGSRDLLRGVYLLVGIPPIAGSVLLLAASHRFEPVQRYRATLVAVSLLAYIGSGLAAFLGTNRTLQFTILTGMGLVASGSVLLAYHPPRSMRDRLEAGGKSPAPGPSAPPVGDRAPTSEQERRREAFRQRTRELV